MNPKDLFPYLAVLFLALAGWRYSRERHWRGAARTWALLGIIFGAVAAWLNLKG
jgi:hypothetical protein